MSWTENHDLTMFGQYNLTQLELDQAWLNVTNLSNRTVFLYQLSQDCLECPFTKNDDVQNFISENTTKIKVDTKFPTTYRLQLTGSEEYVPSYNERHTLCTVETKMGEFGVYNLVVDDSGCEFNTLLEPVSIFLPFLIPIFFYIGLGIVTVLLQKYWKQITGIFGLGSSASRTGTVTSNESLPKSSSQSNRTRLRSLDTFRGICIVIMIFVNDGAAGYAFLEHATWDGLFVADLVFPWFLWIMGVCIPVSIKSQVKRQVPKLTIFKRILIRSIKLILIGIILNSKGGPVEWKTLRLPGVLQRFGLCYLVTASTVLFVTNEDFITNKKADSKYVAMFQDIVFIWKGWVVAILAVILHTCLTFFLKVPGCPTGYLGPGGLHQDNANDADCIGGAAGYIDRKILTMNHVYQWPTAKFTYRSSNYDPEGILGTLTSIFTVWLGVQAGLTLQVYTKHKSRVVRWAVWAVILGALAAALCGGKQTGGPIPLNKNLWSLSFVFTLSCFALILLITLYLVIDVWRVWSGTPFFEPGMNSILLYVGHSVAGDLLPWHFRYKRMNTHFKRLVESLWGTSVWVLCAIYWFHKKIFWSV